jgi:hypothetical protein
VAITITLDGNAWIGSSVPSSLTTGAFTTQDVAIGKIPNILATILQGGNVNDTYSASFIATATPPPTVPEPASMLLMGVGLLGAGLIARRKAAK